MRKILTLLLLATGIFASENRTYIGFEAGGSRINYDSTFRLNGAVVQNRSDEDDAVNMALKVGYYFNENNRVYGIIDTTDFDFVESVNFGAGYDYLIGSGSVKPFVGVLLGYSKNEYSDQVINFDMDGIYYGVQAGVNYAINNNLSIEAGYSFINSKADGSYSITAGANTVTLNTEIDNTHRLYAGVYYRF